MVAPSMYRTGGSERAARDGDTSELAAVVDDEDDEGFVEGEDDARAAYLRRNTKGKERAGNDEDDRVPPQTVIARVLRELEDDFTHYKRYVL